MSPRKSSKRPASVSRRLRSGAVAAVIATASTAGCQTAPKVEPPPPAPAASEQVVFPIMAWNWVPGDAAVMKQMRDCGLTVAGFVAPKDLDTCQAAGLKAIVYDSRVSDYKWDNVDESAARRNVESLVKQVGKHPAVYGYYLTDEPGSAKFAGLAKVAAAVREFAPGAWPYINLFPNYASAEQLGEPGYESYVEKFVAVCKPTTLSYDHYAPMADGSLRPNYFHNLEVMRDAAVKHRLPFWNIVLTVAHFQYREPCPADLRFQVYTTLAYGGRGIAYFTYFAPQVGNYRLAPVDQFGHTTPTWDAMRHVNLQVAKLAPTLMRLTSDDAYHFGTMPQGCHGPRETSLLAPEHATALMAGDFTHADGARYVMIVNKDLQHSIHFAPKFRKPVAKVEMVSPYTGKLTSFQGEQQWLAPGQGVLLKVTWK